MVDNNIRKADNEIIAGETIEFLKEANKSIRKYTIIGRTAIGAACLYVAWAIGYNFVGQDIDKLKTDILLGSAQDSLLVHMLNTESNIPKSEDSLALKMYNDIRSELDYVRFTTTELRKAKDSIEVEASKSWFAYVPKEWYTHHEESSIIK